MAEVDTALVDWREVARDLLSHLAMAMELPDDLGELAPAGTNDVQSAVYGEAMRELGRSLWPE